MDTYLNAKQQELLRELGRIEVGVGTLVASNQRLSFAVTKRKVSGGSLSMARFQDTANLLSVIQT